MTTTSPKGFRISPPIPDIWGSWKYTLGLNNPVGSSWINAMKMISIGQIVFGLSELQETRAPSLPPLMAAFLRVAAGVGILDLRWLPHRIA